MSQPEREVLIRRGTRVEAPPVERAHTAAGRGCPFCNARDLEYADGYWECQNCGEMGFATIVTGLPSMWRALEEPAPWDVVR